MEENDFALYVHAIIFSCGLTHLLQSELPTYQPIKSIAPNQNDDPDESDHDDNENDFTSNAEKSNSSTTHVSASINQSIPAKPDASSSSTKQNQIHSTQSVLIPPIDTINSHLIQPTLNVQAQTKAANRHKNISASYTFFQQKVEELESTLEVS